MSGRQRRLPASANGGVIVACSLAAAVAAAAGHALGITGKRLLSFSAGNPAQPVHVVFAVAPSSTRTAALECGLSSRQQGNLSGAAAEAGASDRRRRVRAQRLARNQMRALGRQVIYYEFETDAGRGQQYERQVWRNQYGAPYLGAMYEAIFARFPHADTYTFVETDDAHGKDGYRAILFDDTLRRTLDAVVEKAHSPVCNASTSSGARKPAGVSQKFLITGTRRRVDLARAFWPHAEGGTDAGSSDGLGFRDALLNDFSPGYVDSDAIGVYSSRLFDAIWHWGQPIAAHVSPATNTHAVGRADASFFTVSKSTFDWGIEVPAFVAGRDGVARWL